MSYYHDIGESPEEDEELIEAVEHLVETAAVSVWSSILEDVQDIVAQIQHYTNVLFPMMVEYRQNRHLLVEDLEKLALSAVVLVLAVLLLMPWQGRKLKKKAPRHGSSSIHPSLDSMSNIWKMSPRNSTEDDSEATDLLNATDEYETDEDRFASMWPSIAASRYRRLVLPPTCRRVDKPFSKQASKVAKASAEKAAEAAAAAAAAAVETEDNPVARLAMYWRHFLHFVKSLFTYDYAGAGWTVVLWLQGIRQYRRQQREQDDAGSVGGATTVSPPNSPPPSVRRRNQNHSGVSTLAGSVDNDDGRQEEKKEPQGSPASSPEVQSNRSTKFTNADEEEDTFHDLDNGDDLPVIALPLKQTLFLQSSSNQDLLLDALQQVVKSSSATHMSSRSLLSGTATTDPQHTTTLSDSVLPVNLASESLRELGQVPHLSATFQDDIVRNDDDEQDEDDSGMLSPLHDQDQRYFFESAATQESLKKLLPMHTALPDANGYILSNDLVDSRCTPLLVFVNSRSGPQQGHMLMSQMRLLLNPIQIWDLADGPPEPVLESFCVLARLRILVCGGDGTVSWIISALERLRIAKWPPIAILPLGTGNDLARIHGWGGGYNNESLIGILEQVSESYVSLLDRWTVTIEELDGKNKASNKRGVKKDAAKTAAPAEVKSFFNYLGVGADAQAALQVHYLRESRPQWFFSRLVNKAWYGVFGAEDLIKASSVHVRKEITLVADGVEIPLPLDSQGIIVLNIDSYAGGVPLWSLGVKHVQNAFDGLSGNDLTGRFDLRRTKSMGAFGQQSYVSPSLDFSRNDSLDDFQAMLSEEERLDHVTACKLPSSCQDGILEVVSIRSAFHLGQIKVGLSNAQRLCQCREIVIKIRKKVAVQVDGEPWRQSASVLRITRKPDPAIMLHRSADDGGVETEMAKLLDWAEERKLIDGQVHSILMKEFSRRIESKTRQRRVRLQDSILHNLKRAIGSSTGGRGSLTSYHSAASARSPGQTT